MTRDIFNVVCRCDLIYSGATQVGVVMLICMCYQQVCQQDNIIILTCISSHLDLSVSSNVSDAAQKELVCMCLPAVYGIHMFSALP